MPAWNRIEKLSLKYTYNYIKQIKRNIFNFHDNNISTLTHQISKNNWKMKTQYCIIKLGKMFAKLSKIKFFMSQLRMQYIGISLKLKSSFEINNRIRNQSKVTLKIKLKKFNL